MHLLAAVVIVVLVAVGVTVGTEVVKFGGAVVSTVVHGTGNFIKRVTHDPVAWEEFDLSDPFVASREEGFDIIAEVLHLGPIKEFEGAPVYQDEFYVRKSYYRSDLEPYSPWEKVANGEYDIYAVQWLGMKEEERYWHHVYEVEIGEKKDGGVESGFSSRVSILFETASEGHAIHAVKFYKPYTSVISDGVYKLDLYKISYEHLPSFNVNSHRGEFKGWPDESREALERRVREF